jgi:DeoR/GlpR family transcriptional regulator of sugar metabolism
MEERSAGLKVDRLKQILEMVNRRKRVALAEIEQMLEVSRITVQRHLVELEARGLIKRFHGGAMSLDFSENISDHDVKKTINVDVKRSIAAKAAKLVKPGMVIGLDASSTVHYLSEQILATGVTAVTCGIDTFTNLAQSTGVTPILTGGRLNRQTKNLAGPETIEALRRYHYDLVFISAEWFDPKRGFFDPYDDEAQVKRALIESASKVAMLLDSSKIGSRGGVRVASIDEVSCMITDNPSDRRLKSVFGSKLS